MAICRLKCCHRTGISCLWRFVKGLSGKKPHNSPNKGVLFAYNTYLDPKKIYNKFAHQYTPPPICLACDKSKTAQTAIPSAAINRDAVFHTCRQKRIDTIGQIVHSLQTRWDEHPPPQDARSWCHQLSH